jgi:hypothetical protein
VNALEERKLKGSFHMKPPAILGGRSKERNPKNSKKAQLYFYNYPLMPL